MKKYLKYGILLIGVILLKLTFTFTLNKIIIARYNQSIYDNMIKILYVFNFNEPYIVYYNHGNILYQQNNYAEAIKKYETSLQKKPPEKKVCDIRVNLSLAIIKNIDINSSSLQIYTDLQKAKNNLEKNNCNQINDKARKLEEEINELEKELENNSSSQNNNQNENEKQEEKNNDDIQEKLKQKEKEAQQNRQANNNTYETMDNNNRNYVDKPW